MWTPFKHCDICGRRYWFGYKLSSDTTIGLFKCPAACIRIYYQVRFHPWGIPHIKFGDTKCRRLLAAYGARFAK